MEKRWIYKPLPHNATFQQAVEQLAQSLGITPFLATLLWQRGISDFDAARQYFRPSLTHLHDPYLMADMDKAVERLSRAIEQGEKILVYGDYDVDGTTSVAMFYDFLKTRYPNVAFYIPDRYTEGYGVQPTGIAYAQENGFSLIVTLDCGIKSVALIAQAQQQGIDFVVCDHHLPGSSLPPAVAVLDPKRSDCPYPFKELTGCGVGFKLLQAYCLKHDIDQATELFPYLDLAVVSIAADIVPIVGENRTLAYFGLQQLNKAPRTGFRALIDVAGFQGELDISSVVFGLAPRINAAGRIKHANDAVQLLLADKQEAAFDFAAEVNKHNTSRKDFDTRITQEALDMIEQDEWMRQAHATVLYKHDWHKGVVGIVASRCIEKYYRPTIILTNSQEKAVAVGSARSVHGFDVYEAINECSDLLEQFGGHMYAAGLTLPVENVTAFRQRFDEVVARRIKQDQLSPVIEVDMKIPLSQINEKFYRIMTQMAPFGPQNMTPAFVSERVQLRGYPRILKEKHLKLDVFQEGSAVFSAIGFGMAPFYEPLMAGLPFDLCYHIEINEYRGERNLQLHLKDIKVHYPQA
jgi:single-stranded-DNA-specific exonuclease